MTTGKKNDEAAGSRHVESPAGSPLQTPKARAGITCIMVYLKYHDMRVLMFWSVGLSAVLFARRIGESRSLRSLRLVHSDGNAVMPYISFSPITDHLWKWPKCWGWKARQTRSKRGQAADVYVSTMCSSMYINSTAVSKIGKSKKTQTVWFPPWAKRHWSVCKVFGRRFTQRYGNNQSFPLVGCVVVDWTAIRLREIDPKWFHWMSWRRYGVVRSVLSVLAS